MEMSQRSEVYSREIESIIQTDIVPWERLEGKNVLITGATGLIGTAIVNTLLMVRKEMGIEIGVYAVVRDEQKAKNAFSDNISEQGLHIIQHEDIQIPLQLNGVIDYIIHGANPTASSYFVDYPVETAKTAFIGTLNMLELAKEKQVKGFVFLSTMEVYGYPNKGCKVDEDQIGGFQTTKVRNSYPISKQMCENLCCAYNSEYQVPAKIVRLTQTFGVGVDYNDKRVFAEFARCAIEKRNIVLKTKGLTERSYLDISDAVTAILLAMLEGKSGEAYTAANEETYCSIYEMARLVADEYGIDVMVEEQDVSKTGYADTLYMDLDTEKIRKLGWYPQSGLKQMFEKMIEDMR